MARLSLTQKFKGTFRNKHNITSPADLHQAQLEGIFRVSIVSKYQTIDKIITFLNHLRRLLRAVVPIRRWTPSRHLRISTISAHVLVFHIEL